MVGMMAVKLVAFFTQSAVLARDWPDLYAQLSRYYLQDPAGIMEGNSQAP